MTYLLTDARGRGTSVLAEVRGGIATFLTMAYILPVNAGILSAAVGSEKIPSLMACTALAAGVCCLLMGLVANVPIALASGMGLNALVAFTIAKQAGSWQAAMGLIVIEGVVILVLVLAGLREAVMRAIPRDMRLAIGAGIGLFIALIGLSNAGLSVQGIPAPPVGPLLGPGNLHALPVGVAVAGLVISSVLMAWRVKGALLIGILVTTGIALVTGVATWNPSWAWPTFSGVAFQADIKGAMTWQLVPLMFAVLMVDFFDTLGTATAIAEEGGLTDGEGNVPNIRRLLVVDSLSASIGGMLGVSSNTCYIESAAGVAEGARTGLHSVVVGVLFLAAIFLSPLAAVIPSQATAPALILVGFLMMKQLTAINFENPGSGIPAFITLLTIPTTFSIAHGIGLGLIAYVVIQIATGNGAKVHPLLYVVAGSFGAFFVFAPH